MENRDINGNEIDMRTYCPMMRCQKCLSCLKERYICDEDDDNFSYRYVPANEIED